MYTYIIVNLLLALSNLSSAAPAAVNTRQAASSSLRWTSCGGSAPSSLQCSSLEVPMNWGDPNGTKITLNMSRLRATNNATRIGSLFINPGGPGGSATSLCRRQAQGTRYFTDTLTSHFDIICADPRGVSTSNPVKCNPDLWNTRVSLFPQNQSDYDKLFDNYKAFGESCLNLTGDIVKYVDTESVARDFEALRVALNEGKLNYLGLSYGTQIGTQYAELYPENIRAMALDGMLDHSASGTYFLVTESETYESELNRFFTWCSQNSTCPLYGQNVSRVFDEVVAKAEASPIPAPGCLPTSNSSYAGTCYPNVTGEDVRFNAQGLLLSKDGRAGRGGWSNLGIALAQAKNGSAELLSSAMASGTNSTIWQGLVVGCLDWYRVQNLADIKYKQQMTASVSPRTRGAAQSYMYEAQCAGWPIAISNPPRSLNQTQMQKTPPILMVNAYYDPSTSYTWANSVKEQVPNAALLTRNGDGHTSYGNGGETTRQIDDFLVNVKLPSQNLVLQT